MENDTTKLREARIKDRQLGLSLIELMIALLLSTLVTLGILTMYLDSTETSQVSRSLSRVQESGRIALDLIARDLRMAGFAGCADPLQDLDPSFVASPLDPDFFGHSVIGARAGGNGWQELVDNVGVPALEDNAVADSDVLQVRRANGPFVSLDTDMAGPASTIETDSDQTVTNFRINENALITNCVTADVFAVGDPDGFEDSEINHQPLSGSYPEGSRIFHFNTSVYWVGDTGRVDERGNAVFALFQNGLEIVTGVERLQAMYGVREEDGSLRFQSADDLDAADWDLVDAVNVGLLVSDEQGTMEIDDTKDYQLPGMTIEPNGEVGADANYADDRRLRTTFAMMVKLRNRID